MPFFVQASRMKVNQFYNIYITIMIVNNCSWAISSYTLSVCHFFNISPQVARREKPLRCKRLQSERNRDDNNQITRFKETEGYHWHCLSYFKIVVDRKAGNWKRVRRAIMWENIKLTITTSNLKNKIMRHTFQSALHSWNQGTK